MVTLLHAVCFLDQKSRFREANWLWPIPTDEVAGAGRTTLSQMTGNSTS